MKKDTITPLITGLVLTVAVFLVGCKAPDNSSKHIRASASKPNNLGGEDYGSSGRAEHTESSKFVTNQESEQYAVVDTKNAAVLLKDSLGKTAWSKNIVDVVNSSSAIFLGEMRVVNLKFVTGGLVVRIGKVDFLLDLQKGDVIASNQY